MSLSRAGAAAGTLRGRLLERALRLLPFARRSLEQVPAYAAAWTAVTGAALAGDPASRLWVVLGDSTAQGVGALAYDEGYVGRVRRLLEQRDGSLWRVANWSRSGARTAEVADVQAARLASLPAAPALVTALVGGNDLRPTPAERLVADVRRLFAVLPPGAVVATLPRGLEEAKARWVNEVIRAEAPAYGLVVADLWASTGPPWRGKYADGFHPNAAGITDWVAAIASALALPAEVDPPQVTRRPANPARHRGRVMIHPNRPI